MMGRSCHVGIGRVVGLWSMVLANKVFALVAYSVGLWKDHGAMLSMDTF